MVNPDPESVKKLWDNWNIRGVILFSLSLQAVLILFAPFRKGTGNKPIISVIWAAYFLEDWAANFGVGLITERARDTPEPGMIKYFERIRALYFASAEKFRDSTLRKQVEHLEKLRALYLENGYVVPIKKDRDYLEVGCQYFKLLRSILFDLIPSFKRVNFEEPSIDDFSPTEALGIIEVELNLVYEVLHTKILVTQCVLGIVLRFICFGSVMTALSVFYFQVEKHGFNEFDVCITYTLFFGAIALDIIAFFMLVFSDWTFVALQNDDDKTRIGNFKNRIAAVLRWFLILKSPRWHSHGGGKYEVLATPFLFRRWSGSVSGYSWIRYWLKARPSRVRGLDLACKKVVHYLGFDRLIPCTATAKNKVIQFLHISKIIDEIRIKTSLSHQPLTKELWHFMFYEIKRKAQYAEDPEAGVKEIICSASGYCTLQELDTNGHLIAVLTAIAERYVYFSINVSVAVWHVSTELLYYTAEEVPNKKTNHAREFSKILSDYMLYLLQLKPILRHVIQNLHGEIPAMQPTNSLKKRVSNQVR